MSGGTEALRAGERALAESWGRAGVPLVAWACAYSLTAWLGRMTILDGNALSLVWPAAGVAVLWFGATAVRKWPSALLLLAVCTYSVDRLTGATATTAWVFVVANVVQVVVLATLLRVKVPHLFGAGGTHPLLRSRDFWWVLGIAALSSVLGAALGSLGMTQTEISWSPTDALAWWGRNASGVVIVAVSGMLVWEQVLRARAPESRERTLRSMRDAIHKHGLEFLLLLALTALLGAVVLLWYPNLSTAFPLLIASIWVGARFSPLTAALHSIGVGSVVMLATMSQHGPFSAIDNWRVEAFLAQFFATLVFGLAVLLALSRDERLLLTRTLALATTTSASQARMLSTMLEAMTEGVALVDEDGRVLLRNRAGTQLLGLEPGSQELHPPPTHRFTNLTGRVLHGPNLPYARAFAGEDITRSLVMVEHRSDAQVHTLAVTVRLLPKTDPRERRRAVVMYQDVTAERARQLALESFAGAVAHDLLNPLAVIDGWAELLATEVANHDALPREVAAPMLERIQRSTGGMHDLVRHLLASSTAQRRVIEPQLIDLNRLVHDVLDMRAGNRGQPAPHVEMEALPPVRADLPLVRQLLDNLLGNAIKYARPGHGARVRVSARLLEASLTQTRQPFVEVTVADDGIGIPRSQRMRVFEAFYRADKADQYGGYGIGLSLCKDIVERHGGTIQALPPEIDDNGNGQHSLRGVRIVFTLPAVWVTAV